MKFKHWTRHQIQILAIRFYQIKRYIRDIYQNFSLCKNLYVITRCLSAFIIVIISITSLWITNYLKDKAQLQTLTTLQQQSLLKKIKDDDKVFYAKLKSLGISEQTLLHEFSTRTVSLSKSMKYLRNFFHFVGFQYQLQEEKKQNFAPHLSHFNFSVSLKSMREQNIIEFLKQLIHLVPGIIIFEKIEIRRLNKILSQFEFRQFIKECKKNKKEIPPNFSAFVTCHIVLPSDFSKTFVN